MASEVLRPKKVVEFQTWGEMLEYAERMPDASKFDRLASRKTEDPSWSGTNTFNDAVALARSGWEGAATNARKLSEALFTKVSSLIEQETISYDVEGMDFDMGEVMRGAPEAWMRVDRHLTEGEGHNIVRVVFNGFFSSGVSTDVILARGATVAALVELLEFAGNRVEVVHHCPFNNTIQFRTIVKTADQPLDLARLMFAVGHNSMFRRVMFSALEHNPDERIKEQYYGSPHELYEEHRGDVYLGCAGYGDTQWTRPDKAEAWIVEQLKGQGVEVSLKAK